jgi:hypothetical protein
MTPGPKSLPTTKFQATALTACLVTACTATTPNGETAVSIPGPRSHAGSSTSPDADGGAVAGPDLAAPPADPACPAGTPDCPCFSNGTCNVVGGIALECRNDRCIEPGTGPAGDLGAPCGTAADCAPYRGLALACISGQCAAPDCPTGQPGCPCIAGEDCTSDAVCAPSGFCARPDCVAGTRGCPCDAAGACTGDLTCVAGTCRAESRVSFRVSSPAARACQGRIEFDGTQAPRVEFDAAHRGQTHRRGQSIGFALVTLDDAPSGAARLDLVFPGAVGVGAAILTESQCFDRLGQALPGPGLTPAR